MIIKKKILRLLRKLDKMRGTAHPQVIFLHIPKCAGSSVNLHFKANTNHTTLLNSYTKTSDDPTHLQRAHRAEFIGGHFGFRTLERIRGENTFAFVFLREPIARLKSLYYFCKTQPLEKNPCQFPFTQARELDFIEFCLSDDPAVKPYTDNAQARTLVYDYASTPECWKKNDDDIIAQAKAHLKQFDYIGFTETLNSDLTALSTHTNTRMLSSNTVKNKTHSSEYEAAREITESEKQQLEPVIKLDEEIYKYAQRMQR